jgi:CRP-like cAMP-binding protein
MPLTSTNLDAEALCQTFKDIPFLQNLCESDCESIAALMTPHELAPGEILFYEDDPSDSVYFLRSGAIEVFKASGTGRKLPLLVLRESGIIGEIGLLLNEPRTATARALSPVVVCRLASADFANAIDKGNRGALDLSLALAKVLASRLRATDAKLFELFESDVSEQLLQQLSQTRAKLLSRMAE